MRMNKYIILLLVLCGSASVFAQKEERKLIRKGNKAYNDSVFVDAEINYRKALDINKGSGIATFNLGNSLLLQEKAEEAMKQYVDASKIETNKSKLAQIYHNIGVLFHSAQDYGKAIEAYKESLRNNPKDDETRYNLAVAQKMLNDQEQNQDQNQDQDQNQEQDQKDKEEQNKDQQQNEDQQKDQQNQDQQQNENEMSKENAEQMLQSVMQDEKDVQDKVKKQMQMMQGRELEKAW